MGETDHHEIDDREGSSASGEYRPETGSAVNRVQQPIITEWTKFVTALFGLAGIGFGLLTILLDAVDQSVITSDVLAVPNEATGVGISLPISGTPYLAVFAAVFVGVGIGWYVEHDDSTAYRIAGVSAAAGTAVFWTLSTFFGTVPFDNISVDLGGLLLNIIIASAVVGFIAAGGVWAARKLTPNSTILMEQSDQDVHSID